VGVFSEHSVDKSLDRQTDRRHAIAILCFALMCIAW